MTGFLLPRLDSEAAREHLQVLAAARDDGRHLAELVQFSHRRAVANPTGGRVISVDSLRELREAVTSDLATLHRRPDWPSRTSQDHRAEYGLALGASLHRQLDINLSDAAHYQGWAFLSLCVLPDVVERRWGDLQEDRFIGAKRDRNYLKVCWQRWRLLGDLLTSGAPRLGEDQLVQLTERTAVARNTRLVRQLTCAVMEYRGMDRMAFARTLMKRAAYWTGPSIVDLWSQRALEQRVSELAHEIASAEKRRTDVDVALGTP